jgi:hypothetical protein
MKMKRVCLIAMITLAGIWGCVPSIHGIATKDTIVWDDNLLGRWGDPDKTDDPNAEVWQFEKGDKEGQYALIHRDDKGVCGQFNVFLVQLGDKLYLDIYPGKDTVEKLNSLSQIHLMPVHTFMIVDATSPQLCLRFMSPDDVKKLLKEQPDLVKHETTGEDGDDVILTAGTCELQQFIMQNADKIFGDKDGSKMEKLQ